MAEHDMDILEAMKYNEIPFSIRSWRLLPCLFAARVISVLFMKSSGKLAETKLSSSKHHSSCWEFLSPCFEQSALWLTISLGTVTKKVGFPQGSSSQSSNCTEKLSRSASSCAQLGLLGGFHMFSPPGPGALNKSLQVSTAQRCCSSH